MTIVECIMAGTGELCINTCPVKCWEKENSSIRRTIMSGGMEAANEFFKAKYKKYVCRKCGWKASNSIIFDYKGYCEMCEIEDSLEEKRKKYPMELMKED